MLHTRDVEVPVAVPKALPFVELRQSFASRVSEISPFIDQLMKLIKPLMDESHREDGSDVDIEIAVREALANAVIHGNDENADRRVYVTCRCSVDGDVLFTIRDEGRGFDVDALPDPTDQGHLLLTHGRGIRLMQALMDEVSFQDNGTVVRLRKRLRAPAP